VRKTGNAVRERRNNLLAVSPEEALAFSETTLRRGGVFLVKLFQGEGMEDFVKLAERRFQKVRLLKPQASRPESRETYLLARNYGM